MPIIQKDEDLFRESTMTFGDHLDELRSCLFWALVWLVGGFVVGLIFFAEPTVAFIQGPLEAALTEYYQSDAKSMLTEFEEQGVAVSGDRDQVAALIDEEDLLPELVYVQPADLLAQLRTIYETAGEERQQAAKSLRAAERLLKQMTPPAGDPEENAAKKPANPTKAPKSLDPESREELVGALETLGTASVDKSAEALGLQDWDALVGKVADAKALSRDEQALLGVAVAGQLERCEEELARIRAGSDSLARTTLPQVTSGDPVDHGDLARMYLWKPIKNDRRIKTRAFGVSEGFMIYVKAALLVGALLGAPGIFWQLWSFVAAGLYVHERKFVYFFGPFSLLLFLSGAALVFFFVFRMVLRFLFSFNQWLGIGIEPRISEWLGFVLILPLGFGIAFQLPLVMLFLHRIGVFSVETYLSKWRIAILVICFLSMLLTPSDPGSMVMMAVPLTVLYFGGILLCRLMPRRGGAAGEPDEPPADDQTSEAK